MRDLSDTLLDTVSMQPATMLAVIAYLRGHTPNDRPQVLRILIEGSFDNITYVALRSYATILGYKGTLSREAFINAARELQSKRY